MRLDELPRFTLQWPLYGCPYCGRLFDAMSMQVDHAIPGRQYVRLKLHELWALNQLSDTGAVIVQEYQDPNNLLLVCQPCNARKSDNLWSYNDFDFLSKLHRSRPKAVQDTLNNAKQWWLRLARIQEKSHQEWITDGRLEPGTSTYQGQMRYPRLQPSQMPFTLENEIGRFFVGRTPPRGATPSMLASQLTAEPSKATLYLCYYCLGLYGEAAFQTDHRHATARSSNPQGPHHSAPTNLIPVCRHCNGSKADRLLTRDLLKELLTYRLDRGDVPGFEHTVASIDGREVRLREGLHWQQEVLGMSAPYHDGSAHVQPDVQPNVQPMDVD